MTIYTRISIPVTKDDLITLRDDAAKHYREPRQHAAWLLRQVLSGKLAAQNEVAKPEPSQPQQPVAA